MVSYQLTGCCYLLYVRPEIILHILVMNQSELNLVQINLIRIEIKKYIKILCEVEIYNI